jgi:AcrR family transcriptional regulator
MDKQEMLFEKGAKVKLIIEAAQKRFGLFGIEKTSMREIADDLNVSKASLYYYFPDKESIYIAVVEKEQAEFLERIVERTDKIKEADKLLLEYSVARLSYFRTLLNLSRLRSEVYSNLPPLLKETISNFREREMKIIVRIIEKGIRDGIFFTENAEHAATLFLDLLKGLRISILNDKKSLIIDEQEFDKLMEKTNSLTEIYIRGLKFRSV